jgi:glycosyltransferase involved in cell wall biosynthesis
MTATSVVYVLPDKVGGVFSVVKNLLQHRPADGWTCHAVLTDNRLDGDARSAERLPADGEGRVEYRLPLDNLYSVLRRLAHAIPEGPGVLVANDWLELAMLSAHPLDRTVISVAHGDFDYYYDLAEGHESLIHCFVAHTDRVHRRLCERLPHRRDSIVKLAHGVAIPDEARRPAPGALRLCYVGRMSEDKGILDLPAMTGGPRAGHCRDLTLGAGPRRWRCARVGEQPRIRWAGQRPRRRSWRSTRAHARLAVARRGPPVVPLEAMAVGVVPVVSDLLSGIPEVVADGTIWPSGAVGDVAAFARAIAVPWRPRAPAGDEPRGPQGHRRPLRHPAARGGLSRALRAVARMRPASAEGPRWLRQPTDRPWPPNAAVRAARAARRWLASRRA